MRDQHEPDFLNTETIDLNSLFTRDVASLGTFDLKGIEASSLGKLLQTIPIPALLVDGACNIAFSNEACDRLGTSGPSSLSRPISVLFADTVAAAAAEALIKRVFATRKPQTVEAPLKKGRSRMWGRLHLRPLRVGKRRTVLILVEDLTLESRGAVLEHQHRQKMQRAHKLLEKRLAERTAEVKMIGSQLKQEIAERKRLERALQKATEQLQPRSELPAEVAGKTERTRNCKPGHLVSRKPNHDSSPPLPWSEDSVNAGRLLGEFLLTVSKAAQAAMDAIENDDLPRAKKQIALLLGRCETSRGSTEVS